MSVMYLRAVPRWVLLLAGVFVISEWLSRKAPRTSATPDTDQESGTTDESNG